MEGLNADGRFLGANFKANYTLYTKYALIFTSSNYKSF